MKASGHFIAVLVKFAAGMQGGHDHFGGGFPFLFVQVHRDAAAIVVDHDRIIEADGYVDVIAKTAHGLIDRIIHDFINQVMQSGGAGAADVHGWTDPDRLQPLQYFYVFCRVRLVLEIGIGFVHDQFSFSSSNRFSNFSFLNTDVAMICIWGK